MLADALEQHRFGQLATDLSSLASAAGSVQRQNVTQFRDLAFRVRRAANVVRNGSTPARQARNLELRAERLRHAKRWVEAASAYTAAMTFWLEAGDETRAAAARRQAYGIERHGEDWLSTRVIFRVFPKREGGEVIALFPDDRWNTTGVEEVSSYMAIGGHCGASPRLVYRTRRATPEESRSLFDALTRLGYDLTVIDRFPRRR